jgi:phosphohistidine phosphatase SixA
MVVGEGEERQERRYSNGEINRELTTLKRILNLARQNGKLMHVPHVPMLKELVGPVIPLSLVFGCYCSQIVPTFACTDVGY